jgi:hypothetical protein
VIELPDEATRGDLYNPAMSVATREEATEYLAALVRRNIRVSGNSQEEAERVERINVGYWTGYCDEVTAACAQELYGFGHPIFGKFVPSAQEALVVGLAMGAAMREATDDVTPTD